AESVPWQRVINSQGKCSTGRMTIPQNLQQSILEQEGVEFDDKGRCDLTVFGWVPERSTRPRRSKPTLLA
ncbi:MAG TPA: hypothetical protein VK918_09065, partial [Pyrinomonadaceae bacterium]|nr:hypothetical protein [Pyrinomonadaceae bacterium]